MRADRLVLRLAVLALAPLLASGCMYSFVGGGLPAHVRTIAIVPFDNDTPMPLIEADLERALRDRIPRDLGVRVAAEDVADAVLRGRITGYDEPRPGLQRRPGAQGVEVVQQRIRVSFEAEIYDQVRDRPIWTGRAVTAEGEYAPDREDSSAGRERAVRDIVRLIVDGAQSDW